MARFSCKCGVTLSNSNNPEIQYRVFSDDQWIELLDKSEDEHLLNIDVGHEEFWKCPSCGRLYFFDGSDLPKAVYKLEAK